MMKALFRLISLCLLCLLLFQTGLSQGRGGKRKTVRSAATVRQEIDALKKGQQQILTELREIRQMLEANEAGPSAPAAAAAPSAGPPRPAGDLTLKLRGEPQRGGQGARLAIIEYSDFQCPFCGTYARETFAQIEENYIKPGKIRYFFRDLPLPMHPNALPAAEAAHCAAEQGKFWEMHDRLFANQNALAARDLFQSAQAIGLDAAKFNQCLMSGKYRDAIRQSATEAESLGINGTPAFLIGILGPQGEQLKVRKVILGAEPYESFKAALDELLSSKAQ
jgi:protein-disulfide isomerase